MNGYQGETWANEVLCRRCGPAVRVLWTEQQPDRVGRDGAGIDFELRAGWVYTFDYTGDPVLKLAQLAAVRLLGSEASRRNDGVWFPGLVSALDAKRVTLQQAQAEGRRVYSALWTWVLRVEAAKGEQGLGELAGFRSDSKKMERLALRATAYRILGAEAPPVVHYEA